MSMSGVELHADALALYQDMQTKHTQKYAVFKISDDKKHVIEENRLPPCKDVNTRETDKVVFDELKAKLTEGEPRYILYDMKFKRKDGRDFNYLIFIYWCSDQAPIKKKMLAAATSEMLKKKFSVKAFFQINDMADLDYNELADEAEKQK